MLNPGNSPGTLSGNGCVNVRKVVDVVEKEHSAKVDGSSKDSSRESGVSEIWSRERGGEGGGGGGGGGHWKWG